MSTKTSIKRIALVAVSALGFGLLSVVPAKAAAVANASLSFSSSVASANVTVAATVGAQASATIRLTTDGASNDTNVVITPTAIAAETTATPATIANAYTSTDLAFPQVGTLYLREAADSTTTGEEFTADTNATTVRVLPGAALTRKSVATLFFTPAAIGTYAFQVVTTGATTNAAAVKVYFTVTNPTASTITQGSIARSDLDYTESVATAFRDANDGDMVVLRCVGNSLNTTRYQWTSVPDAVAGLTSLGTLGAYASCGGASVNLVTFSTTETTLYGTYGLRVFSDRNGDGAYTAAEDGTATSLTFTVALDAKGAASLAISRSSFSVGTGNEPIATLTYSVTDSEGNASYIAAGEANTWSLKDAAGNTEQEGAVSGAGNLYDIVDSAAGSATIQLDATLPADTYTLGVVGPTGTLADHGSTVAFTVISSGGTADTLQVDSASGLVFDATTAGKVTSVDDADAETGAITASTTSAKSITFKFSAGNYSAGAARNIPVTVTVLTGSATGVTGPGVANILPDGTGMFTVTASAPASGDSYSVSIPTSHGAGDTIGFTVTYAGNNPAWSAVSKSPADAFTVKTASTNTVSAILDDTFGTAQASKTVTVTVTGRNPSTSQITTDATGKATFSLTDAGTVAAATTDTIKFAYAWISAAGSARVSETSFVITYTATGLVIGNVTVTPGNATRTVDTVQVLGVPAATAVNTYTATVTDSTGIPVNNVVVVWTADAGTILAKTASATDGSGQATVNAYRNLVGYGTVTATVLGVSGSSATALWSTTAYAGNTTDVFRNITLVGAPNEAIAGGTLRYTATVTDRWGNPVKDVPLTLRLTGAGRLVTGEALSGAAVKTATDGTFQWNVTTLNNETGDSSASVSVTGGQTLDLASRVSLGGTTYVIPGVAAGNDKASATGKFIKDPSVSTADALLELAKAIGTGKEVEAAADAAAEAIDAANAATDAANLAAEAADAATVAAEEARDAADAATAAVEELSTQVATLMAALKAQLTTLANTVAKIAKKVKA